MTDEQYEDLCAAKPGAWVRHGSYASQDAGGFTLIASTYSGPFGGRTPECVMTVYGVSFTGSGPDFTTAFVRLQEYVSRIAMALRT